MMKGLTSEIIAGVHIMEPRYGGVLENPNLPLNSPAIWEEVFGGSYRAATGESLNHSRALTYAPVWQAISLISGDAAKLALILYKQGAGGVRKEVEDDPLADLVQLTPNREEHAFKFWRRFYVHALLWNNAFAYIRREEGVPVELLHLLPDRTNFERHDGDLWCITEVSTPDGGRKLEAIPAADVLHVEGVSVDGIAGCDLVDKARNSWGLGLAQEKFASLFFKNGGRVGGILELPSAMSKPAQDKVKEGFEQAYGGADNPFRTVILRDNAKFHAAQQSPVESQLVEATESQVRQVARWFNLSPSKLGLSDSVSYNSKSEDNQNYLDSTLSHWLKPLAMECTVKLLSVKQRRKMWFEHDTTELLRMNPVQMATMHQIQVMSEIKNKNECRRELNLAPYDGGEKYENPSTKSAESQGKLEETPPEVVKTEEKPDETQPKRSIDHNLARVVFKAGDHARYKASNPQAFVQWIDGGLTSHRTEAKQLLGTSCTIIDVMLNDLRKVAETANAETLPGMVDQLMTTYERSVFQ